MPAEPSLVHCFAGVPDPRIDRTKKHALSDILFITLCAVIVGAESWDTVATFGESKRDWLERFVPLANGIPSPDTFERVFARLDPKAFQKCVVEWSTAVCGATGLGQVAIDGKAVRGAEQSTFSGCLHLVSAWAVENRLILGQEAVADKSNEIAAIPKLLGVLECGPVGDRWVFLALDQRVPFSLYLPAVTDRRFRPIGRRDLLALVVVASPTDVGTKYRMAPFDAAAAAAGVRAALGDIPCTVLASAPGADGPPTLDAVCERITAEAYSLLHVVCHGRYLRDERQTVLYLADPVGATDPVTDERLIGRLDGLAGARGLPHFMFLYACESASADAADGAGGLAHRLVRELGMPAVLAMTEPVTVGTGLSLAGRFYVRLREHGQLDLALAESWAGLAGRRDVHVPALFGRLGGRPLFTDDLTGRPLTPSEVDHGLTRSAALLADRRHRYRTRSRRCSHCPRSRSRSPWRSAAARRLMSNPAGVRAVSTWAVIVSSSDRPATDWQVGSAYDVVAIEQVYRRCPRVRP